MNLTKDQLLHIVNTMSVTERKNWVQQDVLKAWKQNPRSTAELATGVGKTRLAILAIKQELENNPKAIIHIVVPTVTLRDEDWPEEFKRWECAELLNRVKIFCHTSLPKIKNPTSEVDLLVFDEVHHLTSKMESFFVNNKVYKVLGLSATLPPDITDENGENKRALIDKYCPSIYKVSLEEAIELGLIADFEVKVLKVNLDNRIVKNYGTEQKPQKHTELEHYHDLTKKLQRSMFNVKFKFQKFAIIQKRTELIMNLPSKTKLAETCMKSILTEDKRTLIFCGSIEQSRQLCGDNIYNSETKDVALKRFQAKEISYLGVVNALDEGKNINELDQSLIVQLNSNSRRLIQRIGRNLRIRPGHKALIVVLVAKGTADEKWYTSAFENIDRKRIKEYVVKNEL